MIAIAQYDSDETHTQKFMVSSSLLRANIILKNINYYSKRKEKVQELNSSYKKKVIFKIIFFSSIILRFMSL